MEIQAEGLSRQGSFSIRYSNEAGFSVHDRQKMKKLGCILVLVMCLVGLYLLAPLWLFVQRMDLETIKETEQLLANLNSNFPEPTHEVITLQFEKTLLPKIFWIYTDNELEAETMFTLFYLYHHKHVFEQFGYEVRLVNSLTSYDYLTNKTIEMISHAMQNSKVDQPIHSVLKLALLMENGGVLLNQLDTAILGQDFRWMEDKFKPSPQSPKQFKSSIFMLSRYDSTYRTRYIDSVLAATPGGLLLQKAFNIMLNFITTEKFPYNEALKIIQFNKDVGVPFISNLLEHSINIVLFHEKQLQNQGLSSTNYFVQSSQAHIVDYSSLNIRQKLRSITQGFPETELTSIIGQEEVKVLRGLNEGVIPKMLSDLIDNVLNSRNHSIPQYSPDSLFLRMLKAPVNREVFLEPVKDRKVELCVIILQELDGLKISPSLLKLLMNQTYSKWKQIMFLKDLSTTPKSEDQRLIFLKSNSYTLRNIEVAVTKHCSKQSYAILLHSEENLSSPNFLTEIARATAPREVVGAFITLKTKEIQIKPRVDMVPFHRGHEAIVNPNVEKLESILNTMRIFSVESFRYIPQFDLRDINGKYFGDRLIFLMTLLEMIRSDLNNAEILYLIKRYSSLWNVPSRAIFINETMWIENARWESVDREQLTRTRARLQCEDLRTTIGEAIRWKIPFQKLMAFNNGDEFTPVDDMKGPEVIPKVIHQVWLGTNELPPAKMYFFRKTQTMYPDFDVKLWRESNITRDRFPLTYGVIKNLMQFDKKSPYSKLATVTDIIRHELLYHQGGFWKDAGMNLLRPIFHKFLKYKIAIAVDKTFRYRWLQGMCFFANAPKIENMWRITNYRNINRMHLYNSYASSIAGPIDFRQFIIGQEEYDPQILCMPYQTFYPAQVTEHPEKDRCTKRKEELQDIDKYEMVENGWYLLSNCDQLYPYAYALEHNRFGDSWAKRRDN